MFNVVTFGGATQDNFIRISASDSQFITDSKTRRELIAFEHNAKIPIEEAVNFPGGGAFNVSIALKKLGLVPIPVMAVGWDHFGQNILERLNQNGISDEYVLHLQGVHTAFSTIIGTEKGDRTAFVFRGASDHISKEHLPNFKKLAKAQLLAISNLSGKSHDLLPDIFGLKDLNPEIKIAWNPGLTQIRLGLSRLKEYLTKTDVVLLNKEEAETLTGVEAESGNFAQLQKLTSIIRGAGAHIAVITDAKNGACAETSRGFYSVGEFPNMVVNTTGAGDSFFAGLIFGLHTSHDISTGLLFGSINAASTVGHMGAQNGYLDKEEIDRTIAQNPQFQVRQIKL